MTVLAALLLALAGVGPRTDAAVQDAAARFDVPAALLHALIRVESLGRPNAVSARGCMGLTQLNPPTAREVARRIGLRRYRILDVEDNVTIGAAYLREMYDRYGSWPKALTAYNAGPGRFRQWGYRISRYARKVMARWEGAR